MYEIFLWKIRDRSRHEYIFESKKCIIFNVFKIVKTIDHPRKEISNETKLSNQIFLIFDFEEGRKKKTDWKQRRLLNLPQIGSL